MTRSAAKSAAAAAIALSALVVAHPLAAGEMKPISAQSIALGAVNGVAYYTTEADGFHVVATLADADSQPMRFEATLAQGQSMIVSVPRGYGEPADSLKISRVEDRLFAISATPAAAKTQELAGAW